MEEEEEEENEDEDEDEEEEWDSGAPYTSAPLPAALLLPPSLPSLLPTPQPYHHTDIISAAISTTNPLCVSPVRLHGFEG